MPTAPPPPRAVTFDFGQTLAELDTALLAARLRERDLVLTPQALEAAVPLAWAAYDRGIYAGEGGHPWGRLMTALLTEAGGPQARLGEVVAWLFAEQRSRNLWRRPIPGMIELVRRLARAGVPVGVISNSEGRLAELAAEMGWGNDFRVIVDSGVLGIQKPDAEIFEHTATQLAVATEEVVHVGDSLAADVEGAVAAGMRAIWFRGEPGPRTDHVQSAADAAAVEAALLRWGLRPAPP